MAQVLEKTGKSVEEALGAALRELKASKEQVTYEVLEQPSKGFFGLLGTKPARVRVTWKEEEKQEAAEAIVEEAAPAKEAVEEASPAEEAVEETVEEKEAPSVRDDSMPLERVEKFLTELFAAMKLEIQLKRSVSEEGYVFDLVGEDLGILIGKHGQTLDSLQYLANLAANRGLTDERIRVILDVEQYRSRREETLKRLAYRLADKASRMHEEIKLEPMNRHERKIIHMTLQDSRRVTTTSAGEEPYRYIVIAPRRGGRYRDRHEEHEEN